MKIATCCYCGVRAALVLDKTRHELSCGACGAPLHEMKMMPVPAQPKPANQFKATVLAQPSRRKPLKKKEYDTRPSRRKPTRKTLGKRIRWGREMLEDLWDEIEDIFD